MAVSSHIFNELTEPPIDSASNAGATGPGYVDFPCSVAQERFWLLDRLEPGNPSYNVAVRWRLEGRVSSELLESAWREIIARHEVLRTRFLEIDGKPVQRVASHSSFKLVEIDLSSLSAAARSEEGDRIGLMEARAPFDVGSGPLIRVVLLRYSSSSAIILVTTHQIVSDGWSIGVMAREMGAIYRELAMGLPPSLEPLAIQYGDYAQWQLEWLRQRGIQAETAYWSRQLESVAPFEVVADRPRPAVPTTNGAIASIVLPRELTNRMQALSAAGGTTLFAAAVAALCAILARYTAKTEVVLGTQVSDRDQVELEPMIGQFVNSLILRNDLRGDPRFSELLERTGSTISAALEHRNIPIERLLAMVKAGRGGSSSPPVSVNFIFQRTFIENRHYGDFALLDMPSLPAGAIYDLNFFMVERPDGWRFSCQFNTDQFEAATANRLLRYFQSALESAVATPTRRLSELRLADPAQINDLLPRLQGPAASYPENQTVGALIAAQAKGTPDSIAALHGDRRVTFAQLEAAAHKFGLLLASHAVGPGARVAIQLPRSIELLIAILGVWKSGAAYVALNAEDSLEQTQRLIDSSGAELVVTTRNIGPTLKAPKGVITALTPAAGAAVAAVAAGTGGTTATRGLEGGPTLPPARTEITSPAAIWFSADDRGRPVALQISHVALVNELSNLQNRLGITSTDVFVSLALADAATLPHEFFLPLTRGARIALATGPETTSSSRLQHLLKRARVTTVITAPATCGILLEAVTPGQKITRVLCERGALSPATLTRLLNCTAEVWALQAYPETSGCVSARRVQQAHDQRLLSEPFANMQFRVLDATLKSPPLGAGGEVYIGGNLGLVDDSDQDDGGRFIVDPADGVRLFRTGRAARLSADGIVEIIDDRPSQEAPAPAAGKDHTQSEIDPQTEHRLAAIWAELLGVQSIDVTANFFELGGHSLLAARMLARVEAQFGRRITLASLFRAPSIRGLARALRSDTRDFDFRQMVKLQAGGSNLPLIAINNTGVYYLLAKKLGSQQPVTSLQVFDPSAKHETLPDTLEEIAAEYVKLIRRVHPDGPYVLAGWCVAGSLALEIARQLVAAKHEVSNVFLIDSWVPRYFTRLPLLRRVVGNYSLRWQLAWQDWRRFTSGDQTLTAFINQRVTVQKIRALLSHKSAVAPAGSAAAEAAGPEDYDRWLLAYLQEKTERYDPKEYSGRITLFRSRREPTGWLFDPLAGWGPYAAGGIKLEIVEGNHFTMFQDPGASEMAERMAALIGPANETASRCASGPAPVPSDLPADLPV